MLLRDVFCIMVSNESSNGSSEIVEVPRDTKAGPVKEMKEENSIKEAEEEAKAGERDDLTPDEV